MSYATEYLKAHREKENKKDFKDPVKCCNFHYSTGLCTEPSTNVEICDYYTAKNCKIYNINIFEGLEV